jgi:aminoglycoside/choline kinase family phosphotransferase
VSLTGVEPLERVGRFVDGIPELDVDRIEPLAGDASNRAYFRLVLADGAKPGKTRIVALLPEAFEPASLPFLNVAALFAKIPIRTPEVLHVAGEQGALVLEDLGDNLLQDAVGHANAERKAALYREAIDILARLQRRGKELASKDYVPYRIAFDAQKFMWELEFFRKHFLEGLRGETLDASELEELETSFRAITAELCEHPFVLCHRDYHARNLMVPEESDRSAELVVIDFQDARQGPRGYDFVSLVNDSYVAHTPELVAAMTERFQRAIGADLSAELDVAALQRNLKALGTFGYQIGQRDNPVYARYVEGTLRLIGANLERNPRWDALRRILARHCEEIG